MSNEKPNRYRLIYVIVVNSQFSEPDNTISDLKNNTVDELYSYRDEIDYFECIK